MHKIAVFINSAKKKIVAFINLSTLKLLALLFILFIIYCSPLYSVFINDLTFILERSCAINCKHMMLIDRFSLINIGLFFSKSLKPETDPTYHMATELERVGVYFS